MPDSLRADGDPELRIFRPCHFHASRVRRSISFVKSLCQFAILAVKASEIYFSSKLSSCSLGSGLKVFPGNLKSKQTLSAINSQSAGRRIRVSRFMEQPCVHVDTNYWKRTGLVLICTEREQI